MKALISDDVLYELDLSLEAEASGDVDAAIQHFAANPLADSSPHLRYMQEVRDLGDSAPGWVWSRWTLRQAHRWLILRQDERIYDAVFVTVDRVYSDVDPQKPLGHDPRTFLGQVMALDWMCREVALFEMGGLGEYLSAVAQPPLLRRADRIMAWPAAKMSAFRIEDAAAGTVTLTDLGTGARREVLNIGHLAEGIGLCVVGRLAPMRCDPGWIFESRPLEVSDAVAKEVGRLVSDRSTLAWTGVLADAVATGELDWSLEPLACLTALSSDLLPYAWSAPHGELPEAAYEVCENALSAAAAGGAWAVRAAPYMAAVLTNPYVYAAAKERLTSPVHAEAWRALGANTHEPVRTWCQDLADRCRKTA